LARVLVVVENLSVPLDRRVWQESLALTRAGHEVTVICPQTANNPEPFERLEEVEIHRYPLRPATGGPAGYLREYGTALWHTFRLARRLQRRARFDVVHICNPPDLLFLCVLPLKRRGTLVVFDQHDLVPELFLSRFGTRNRWLLAVTRLLERLTYRSADAVLATNESYRRTALTRGGLPPERVTVVRSAPDLSRFKRVDPVPELRRGKAHLLCYLGVMGPQDGVDYALRALAHLRHELGRDDFQAAFIGSGDVRDQMIALGSELGLDGEVVFTGRISDDELAAYLSTADVCIAPDPKNPLNDVSTMNKVVEYMAMGRAIVSFDLVESRVSAGEAAVYATPNDELELAGLIAELLDDPERRARMGEVGQRRLEEELSWDRSAANLVDAYARLLDAGRRAR
jgi:glycosyltransferase involved in cell wall biosynthesis